MNQPYNAFDSLQKFDLGNGQQGTFYSLPALEKTGVGTISTLPVSIRLVLESVLRNCYGKKVTEASVKALPYCAPTAARNEEIAFSVARIVLQHCIGAPLLMELVALRSAVAVNC